MPRILVVNNIPSPYNDALFACLAGQAGVQLRVAYCASQEQNRSWRLPGDKGYDYLVMKGRSFAGSAHLNPGVLGVIRRFRPDVAVLSGSYTMPTMQLAAAVLRARRVPWVYWSEELGLEPVPLLRRVARRTLRRTLLAAHGVLAIGSRAGRSYRRIGVPPARIADFRYYADVARFRTPPAERDRARAEVRAALGIDAGALVFLYCGQMIARKGVDTLLGAHALLRGEGVEATVVLAGDGPEQGALARMAGELGTADAARFTGFVQPDELPRLFAASDAFVLPSRREGWGVVVHEAMAAGLPVIASDQVNAAVDLVAEGESGWLFPAGDAETLAARMREFCGHPDRQAVGANARAVAEREAPERMAPRLVSLLGATMAGEDLCSR
ncbi:MAG TPA: glycosyltransferase family 4 protein [Longimicrobium sp.]|jgi:glycosyltransferase involved in cell wall biosynthesis